MRRRALARLPQRSRIPGRKRRSLPARAKRSTGAAHRRRLGDNGPVSTRSLLAFSVGAALFVLAPPFRYVLPVHRPDPGHQAWVALLAAAAVGALVAAIADRPRGWLVAAA